MASGITPEALAAANSFALPSPYAESMKAIRSALAGARLEIWAELDVARKIRHAFSIRLGRCALLSVGCPYTLLRVLVAGPAAVSVLPLHVVVAERAGGTQVYVLNAARLAPVTPNAQALKIDELMARLHAAIEKAGGERMAAQGPLPAMAAR
jgi:uncharacterized protein (DUF302 family)